MAGCQTSNTSVKYQTSMAETCLSSPETQKIGPKKIQGSVLEYFRHITNDNENTRRKNSCLLLKQLRFSDNNENDSKEVNYALVRLIRGLGSSRNSARVGFYSTLVASLNVLPSLQVQQVLECVGKQLQAGDCNSKSENGDVFTGQILACGALIRSGLFLKGSAEEQKVILEKLLKAAKQRSYLPLAASIFLVDLLNTIDANQFGEAVWPALKEEVLKPWPEQTLDSLYLLFVVQNKFPQSLKGASLKKCLGTREILVEENVKPICDVLLTIAAVSSLKHPAYALISQEIASSDMALLFITHVNTQLVSINRNKLLAVSIIIRHMLANLKDPSQIPELVTPNFVQQMLHYYRTYHNNNHDAEFQACMTKLFDALVARLKLDQVEAKTKVAVIKTFLFYPGSFMLENITKLRILQQIVQGLDAEGVKKLSKLYKEVIVAKKEKVMGEGWTEPWVNAERIYAAQLLVKLLSHPSVQGETAWKMDYLRLLMDMGIVRDGKHSNVGNELAGALRDIFFRALDQKFSKLEDMHVFLGDLTDHLKPLITPNNYEEVLRTPLTEEDYDVLQKTYAVTAAYDGGGAEGKHALIFQILFLHMGLQLFKDRELAVPSLQELFACYEKVQHEKKKKRDDEEPEWIEVVVDLFLNLLSHNSHLLRNIIGSVFPHLCKHVTPSSMHQILSVLDPRNETNPLSRNNQSDEESDDDDAEDDKEDEADESDDEKEEESGSDTEEENQTINDKLRMAVSEALGRDGYQTDEESIDLDQMSDSEGQRLDEALAEAFRQFKPNRGRNNNKQTKNEQTLTHFRVRALDLVEIYLDSEPAMLSCLEIMLPLLQTLEFTIRDEHQNPLQMRVKHCLKKLTNSKKFGSTDGVTDVVLSDMLDSLLQKGTKSTMMIQDMSSEISDCSLFLIKCSQILCSSDDLSKKTKKKLRVKIIGALTTALNTYFNQRDCLIPYSLFKSTFQCNWDGNLELAPLLFDFAFADSIRQFRKHQALELLKLFYLNRRIHNDLEAFKLHVGPHETQFCARVLGLFDDFCASPQKHAIKERFVYHLFNALKVMTICRNPEVDWKAVGERVREYRSYVSLSKDAKSAYNQLCAKLQIPNVVKMKNQVLVQPKGAQEADEDEEEGEDSKPAAARKIRGKSGQDAKKLRKEARDLRVQSLSEGLSSSFSFSNVNAMDIKIQSDLSDDEDDGKNYRRKSYGNGTMEIDDDSEKKKHKKNKNKLLLNGSFDEAKHKKSKKRFNSENEAQSPTQFDHKRIRR